MLPLLKGQSPLGLIDSLCLIRLNTSRVCVRERLSPQNFNFFNNDFAKKSTF